MPQTSKPTNLATSESSPEYLPLNLADYEFALYVRQTVDDPETEQRIITPVGTVVRVGAIMQLSLVMRGWEAPWVGLNDHFVVAASLVERGLEWERKEFVAPLRIVATEIQQLLFTRPARFRIWLSRSGAESEEVGG